MSISDYIAAQPKAVQPILRKIRAILKKALPQAEEVISYQMPAFRLSNGVVVYFAVFKHHWSLFPAVGGAAEAMKEELAPYRVSKGTLRFPLDGPVPVRLLTRFAKLRAKELAEKKKR